MQSIVKLNRRLITARKKLILMTTPDIDQATALKDLEQKLELLIEQYSRLKTENRTLKAKQEALVKEKAKLIEKTNLARLRVEAMISRLKAMEHGS